MTTYSISPAKRQAEIHIFSADFSDQLRPGETITDQSWEVTVTVVSGVDPTPSTMIPNPVTVAGNVITQQVQEGIVGVIYLVTIAITTSLNRGISEDTRIAVLPNNYPAGGVFISLFETSWPYPIYVQPDDTLSFVPGIVHSRLDTTLFIYSNVDTLHFISGVTGGTLDSTTQTYIWGDTLDFTAGLTSGTLVDIIITYAFMDTLHFAVSIKTSKLDTIVIRYSFSDTLNFTAGITSGTLA